MKGVQGMVNQERSVIQSECPYRRCLKLFLTMIGTVSLFAFAAAIMPEKWMVGAAEFLGFDPFPHSPLTFYLARNLSLLYGFVGVLMLFLASDMERYHVLIRLLAAGTIVFGLLQLVVDYQAAMPAWWVLAESLSTLWGGLVFYWVQSKVRWTN
ncbi:hypothetical protein OAE79_02225 [Rhodopirellula sp.]|nr:MULTISPECIES: hypothetical protein [Pirellulaceae]MDB4338881.1 hypothetical protein [Rubripirellula sp.]MDB4679134.1 hypothetical protein [Rhodopirellula sp.]